METVKSIGERKIMIPTNPVRLESEQEVEEFIADFKKKITIELENIIATCKAKGDIPEQNLIESKNEFFATDYFTENEEVDDERKWDELNKEWWKLNETFFKLQEKLLDADCDRYDLDYTFKSELYQLLHEHPDKRRLRLEGPIKKEIEAVERKIEKIDIEQQKLTTYSIVINSKELEENLQKFHKKLLPVSQ